MNRETENVHEYIGRHYSAPGYNGSIRWYFTNMLNRDRQHIRENFKINI